MDNAPKARPSRWAVFLDWLTMFERSPEEHLIDYLEQVEGRLRRLEKALQQEQGSP